MSTNPTTVNSLAVTAAAILAEGKTKAEIAELMQFFSLLQWALRSYL